MFCPKCGFRVEDGIRFCPQCGNALSPVALPPPVTPRSAPAQPTYLPPGMSIAGGGAIRWLFVQNMLKDNYVMKVLLAIFGITCGVMSFILFLVNLQNGIEDALKMLLFVGIVPFIILMIISVLSWLLLCAIKGGKQYFEYFMNESSILFNGGSMQNMTTFFKDVKTIKTRRKTGLIILATTMTRNTIYASPEQYEFVLNFLRAHCPQARIKD